MARVSINFGTIFKRSSCLNSVNESAKVIDPKRLLENVNVQIASIKKDGYKNPSVKNLLKNFIESICNYSNANKYYREPIYFIQEFNDIDESISSYILSEYVNRIIPYVENLSTISESVSRFNIKKSQKDTIIGESSKFIIADRILSNHKKISSRFNILNEIQQVNSRGLKYVAESCCSMIDTYTITPYAKMNLCLEEMCFLMNKENIAFDKKELVKYVTEYFLINSTTLTSKDIRGYKTVLSENCFIEDCDSELVSYITHDDISDMEENSIKNIIASFLLNSDKSIENLNIVINRCIETSPRHFKYNISKIFMFMWDLLKSDLFDYNELLEYISDWFAKITGKIKYDSTVNSDIDKEDLSNMINEIDNVIDSIIITGNDSYDYYTKSVRYKAHLTTLSDNLKYFNTLIYSNENLNAIRLVNSTTDSIPLNEFKIFKFNNLVKAAVNISKLLKKKARNIYNRGNNTRRKGLHKIGNVLFGESATVDNYLKYIGEDSRIDLCCLQLEVNDSDISEVQDLFEEICKELNDGLVCENIDNVRCYYLINPGVAELHLKESSIIELTEEVEKDTTDIDHYIEEFCLTGYCLESFDYIANNESNIMNKLSSYCNSKSATLEGYEVAMEALSFINISKEQVDLFTESFDRCRYSAIVLSESVENGESVYIKESRQITNISNNWVHEDNVPIDIELEAYQILSAVLEADMDKKPKDNPNTKVDESRKNPFSGINLNKLKLYLEGLKSKMKDMSQKEKEASRNIDNTFRRFVKSMKDALVSDRREAIIKGSVIPSLSRCIKIAIGLAGTGLITQNPLVPLLIAVGGFAASKRLTHKERLLLLDEIETELEVVDKEIANADAKNQIKKYRTLLKYKKDLQRQYQRIRYNIRIGKDIMVGSSSGIPSRN